MTTHDQRVSHPRGRHPVNIVHLVMGVVFVGLAFVWALVTSDAVALRDIRWLLPIPWVAAGAVGLAATLAPSRRRPTLSPTQEEQR